MPNFLFDTNPLPQVDATSSSTTAGPLWHQQAQRELYGKASSIAGEEYQNYGGARIAGLDPMQTKAYDRSNRVGQFDPYFSSGRSLLENAADPNLDTGAFNSYMNPYISQVSDEIARRGTRNLNERLLPAVNDSFIGSGQFKSGRQAELEARALRDTNESIMGQQAQLLNTGFADQMKNYNEGMGRGIAGGREMGALGTGAQSTYLRDSAGLEAAGAAQQGQSQRNLDLAYGDFLNQREYPRQNVSFMSNVVRGLQVPTNTTTQTSAPGTQANMEPSALGQVAGAGLGVLGLGKAFGWFRNGGAVRGVGRYAEGGRVRYEPYIEYMRGQVKGRSTNNMERDDEYNDRLNLYPGLNRDDTESVQRRQSAMNMDNSRGLNAAEYLAGVGNYPYEGPNDPMLRMDVENFVERFGADEWKRALESASERASKFKRGGRVRKQLPKMGRGIGGFAAPNRLRGLPRPVATALTPRRGIGDFALAT